MLLEIYLRDIPIIEKSQHGWLECNRLADERRNDGKWNKMTEKDPRHHEICK